LVQDSKVRKELPLKGGTGYVEGYPGGSRLTGIPGPVYIEPYSSIRQAIWPHTMYPCSTRRLINPGTQENPSYRRELRIKQMREIALNMCIE
jgi:hypothetical protein